MSANNATYYVKGMHCRSCEILIESKLKETFGVRQVKASTSKGTVEIISENNLPGESQLNKVFANLGYHFSCTPIDTKGQIIYPVIFAGLLYFIFSVLGLWTVIPQINVSSGSTLGAFFLFGLTAGVSSCAALVGTIVLALAKKWGKLGMIGIGSFLVGRIISYAVTGWVLGLSGKALQISTNFSAILMLVVSVFMILVAFQMMGFQFFSLFQPKSLNLLKKDLTKVSKPNMLVSFVTGASTIFVPCGFSLTSAGFAATSGNAGQGLLIMLAFAMGTVPALLVIGLAGHRMLNHSSIGDTVSKIAAVIILTFALSTISYQFNLINFSAPGIKTVEPANTQNPASGGVQIIKMNANSRGYTPSNLKVKVNVPVRWEITDTGTSGCTNAVIANGLFGGQIPLIPGKTSVKEFTPTQTGTYRFSCWMGMIKGTIEVTN